MRNNDITKTILRRHGSLSRDLQATAIRLVELCDAKGYRVIIQAPSGATNCAKCARANFPSSMACHACQTVWLNPTTEGEHKTPEALVVSLAHETGHLHDSPKPEDATIVEGSPQWVARMVEREDFAWCWAEAELRGTASWRTIASTFDEARRYATHKLQELYD